MGADHLPVIAPPTPIFAAADGPYPAVLADGITRLKIGIGIGYPEKQYPMQALQPHGMRLAAAFPRPYALLTFME